MVLRLCAVALVAWLSAGCGRQAGSGGRVVVLGFDGMDYALTADLMARGQLPNLARLARSGSFGSLATANPPQSPVAWSSFTTGLDPGEHGVFDFIHRDPKTMEPYLSTARTVAGDTHLQFGRWRIPLSSGRVELLRQGRPFWEVLEERGIETVVVRMPANFPPSGTAGRELSGMGTPDALGGYGTFSFFTSDPAARTDRSLSGGVVYRVDAASGVVRANLEGPETPFLVQPEPTAIPLEAHIDATRRFVKLVVGTEVRLLKAGEWSDWVPAAFSLGLGQSLPVQYRFYAKRLDPFFELYATPPNLDAYSPAMPISTPGGFASELAHRTGRFFTQGMPEDTKSLKTGVLTPREFLRQASLAGQDVEQQFDVLLDRLETGLLFYYVGNVDQVSHMMWRARDPLHPAYVEERDRPFEQVVEEGYRALDALVGRALAKLSPDDLLIVMSDHGFTSWRRSFNVNSWLRDNGYLALLEDRPTDGTVPFENIDWSRTRAYGLGLNGLYLNVAGRERGGIVSASGRAALAAEIAQKLAAVVDPETGERPVSRVFRREDVYHTGRFDDIAPDLIVGYAKGVRASDESSLGGVPAVVMSINDAPWNGDHCMDPEAVPGVLFSSRPLKRPAPALQGLAASILDEFGVESFPTREVR